MPQPTVQNGTKRSHQNRNQHTKTTHQTPRNINQPINQQQTRSNTNQKPKRTNQQQTHSNTGKINQPTTVNTQHWVRLQHPSKNHKQMQATATTNQHITPQTFQKRGTHKQ